MSFCSSTVLSPLLFVAQSPVTLPELPPEELEKEDEEEEIVEAEPAGDEASAEAATPAASSANGSSSSTSAKKFKVSRQYGGSGGNPFDHRNVSHTLNSIVLLSVQVAHMPSLCRSTASPDSRNHRLLW